MAEAKTVKKHKTLIDDNSQVLIAGTLPGDNSKDAERYYVDNRNAMGEILKGLKDCPDIDAQAAYLSGIGVALGDVYASGQREGSSDGKIKDPTPNKELVDGIISHSGITRIIFNGKEAAKGFKGVLTDYYKLPKSKWRKRFRPVRGGVNVELEDGSKFHVEQAYTLNLDTHSSIICCVLPSTSGANSTLCKKAKIDIWNSAIKGRIEPITDNA